MKILMKMNKTLKLDMIIIQWIIKPVKTRVLMSSKWRFQLIDSKDDEEKINNDQHEGIDHEWWVMDWISLLKRWNGRN